MMTSSVPVCRAVVCAWLTVLAALALSPSPGKAAALLTVTTDNNQNPNPKPTMAMATHEAFKGVGQKSGLLIWRIEKFQPVLLPSKDHGKFHSGDSYLLLNTKQEGKNSALSWDIHFWLGNQTSQDESGTAAILAVDLDDSLGGGPVQYREVQDHESKLFLSYFENGVRYMPGGVASGFTHAEVNADGDKKLYQVKGKTDIRVTQVALDVKSMNDGDCFILDEGKGILVYVGAKAKRTERLKAIQAANQIRDQDHNGRAQVTIIDDTSNDEEVQQFFTALGSGSVSDVAPAPAQDDDESFAKKQDAVVTLHKVSDASGKLVLEKLPLQTLSQSALKTDDCFILNTGSAGIYVWIGSKGTSQEKSQAFKHGQSFLEKNNYPNWTQVTRVVEGGEPAAFKQYFSEWRA